MKPVASASASVGRLKCRSSPYRSPIPQHCTDPPGPDLGPISSIHYLPLHHQHSSPGYLTGPPSAPGAPSANGGTIVASTISGPGVGAGLCFPPTHPPSGSGNGAYDGYDDRCYGAPQPTGPPTGPYNPLDPNLMATAPGNHHSGPQCLAMYPSNQEPGSKGLIYDDRPWSQGSEGSAASSVGSDDYPHYNNNNNNNNTFYTSYATSDKHQCPPSIVTHPLDEYQHPQSATGPPTHSHAHVNPPHFSPNAHAFVRAMYSYVGENDAPTPTPVTPTTPNDQQTQQTQQQTPTIEPTDPQTPTQVADKNANSTTTTTEQQTPPGYTSVIVDAQNYHQYVH